MNLKRTKIILIGLFAIACIGIGLTEIDFQSVGEYRKEAKKIQRDLQRNEEKVPCTEAPVQQDNQEEDKSQQESPDKTDEKKEETSKEKKKESQKDQIASKKGASDKKKNGSRSTHKKEKHKKRNHLKRGNQKRVANKNKGDSNKKDSGKKDIDRETGQKEEDKNTSCTIEIRCDNLLDSGNNLDSSLKKYIPKNGIILSKTKVQIPKGSTVYDVLKKACMGKSIPLDAEYTPMYKTYYVRGIGHLYEKQAGDMSGWLYYVNGKKPEIGSSSCEVNQGDNIQWRYTCNGKN